MVYALLVHSVDSCERLFFSKFFTPEGNDSRKRPREHHVMRRILEEHQFQRHAANVDFSKSALLGLNQERNTFKDRNSGEDRFNGDRNFSSLNAVASEGAGLFSSALGGLLGAVVGGAKTVGELKSEEKIPKPSSSLVLGGVGVPNNCLKNSVEVPPLEKKGSFVSSRYKSNGVGNLKKPSSAFEDSSETQIPQKQILQKHRLSNMLAAMKQGGGEAEKSSLSSLTSGVVRIDEENDATLFSSPKLLVWKQIEGLSYVLITEPLENALLATNFLTLFIAELYRHGDGCASFENQKGEEVPSPHSHSIAQQLLMKKPEEVLTILHFLLPGGVLQFTNFSHYTFQREKIGQMLAQSQVAKSL